MSTAFEDFDDQLVYERSLKRVLDPRACNFVLEFNVQDAHIQFDLSTADFVDRLRQKDGTARHVRWINIWNPDLQQGLITALQDRYKFSPRFTAILRTRPLQNSGSANSPPRTVDQTFTFKKDVEATAESSEMTRTYQGANVKENHYSIATQMTNFQSVDIGPEFFALGANWMHRSENPLRSETGEMVKEIRQWAWLILCKDGTVISIHEPNDFCAHRSPDGSRVINHNDQTDLIAAVRRHTKNVLSQLSNCGRSQGFSLELISLRQPVDEANLTKESPDMSLNFVSEASSSLFYYLFDDWYSTLDLVRSYHKQLGHLSDEILRGLDGRQDHDTAAGIIEKLYVIGKQLRTTEHLHEGYRSLIVRILQSRTGKKGTPDRISVAVQTRERFERLRDRIQLLVLSTIKEAIQEKDALISTHFNILSQKDSEATAKLNKNAAILSKLGVVFLPVSLMTSYFSVQIQELQGVYTAETYWVCFAIVVAISILALFFFSFLLVRLGEMIKGAAQKAFYERPQQRRLRVNTGVTVKHQLQGEKYS